MSGRALITGAGGFVGRILAAHLETRGWDVAGCDALEAEGLILCDVSRRDQVERVLTHAGAVTHVFHLAAVTFVPESGRDPAHTFEVNVAGTVHVIEALKRHAPRARLINVSSSEVYGPPQSLPMTEEHPLLPANPYAIAKAAADLYCAYAHKAEGIDVVRMRPFNHSGPGQSDRFVLSSFARQIAQIEAHTRLPVLHVGNLAASRDFLHVRDVVRAYELAALEGATGEAYNVCSGRAISMRDALDKLRQLSLEAIEVEVSPERVRPVDVPEYRGSHEKFTRATGWRPELPFADLLADLLAYWRTRETP